MHFNPFSFLIETKNHPLSRIRRSYFFERMGDTWHVMAGRIGNEQAEYYGTSGSYTTFIGINDPLVMSLGVVDYLSLGVFLLLHVFLCQFNKYLQSLESDENLNKTKSKNFTAFLSWSYIYIINILNLIRYLIALILTLVMLPLVIAVHGFFTIFAPPVFRKEELRYKYEELYLGKSLDKDEIILVDELPTKDTPGIVPFVLYVNKSKTVEKDELEAGWFSVDINGEFVFKTDKVYYSTLSTNAEPKELDVETLRKNYRGKLCTTFKKIELLNSYIHDRINTETEFLTFFRLLGCGRLVKGSDNVKLHLLVISKCCFSDKEDLQVVKIDPKDKTTMQKIKDLVEHNVFGITSNLEEKGEYQDLKDHLDTLFQNSNACICG